VITFRCFGVTVYDSKLTRVSIDKRIQKDEEARVLFLAPGWLYLESQKVGMPGRARTCDQEIRNLLLFRLSYGHISCGNSSSPPQDANCFVLLGGDTFASKGEAEDTSAITDKEGAAQKS
jgi:hypothetical protein